jgi:hypothetical protein
MKYAIELGSGAMLYIPGLIKIGSGIQILLGGGGGGGGGVHPHKHPGVRIRQRFFF